MAVGTPATARDAAAQDEMHSNVSAVTGQGQLQPLLQMCNPTTISQLQHYSRATIAQPPAQFDPCNPVSSPLHRGVGSLDDSFTASALPAPDVQKQDSQGDEVNQEEGTMGGRKRKASKLWAHEQILGLLDLYQDKWVSLEGGNFKWKHWAILAEDLNTRFETNLSDAQCKNKWDALKKTFLKEKAKASLEASRWEFFDRFTEVLAVVRKVKGLGGDHGKDQEYNVHLIGEDEENPDGFANNIPSVEHDYEEHTNTAQEPDYVSPILQAEGVQGGDTNTIPVLEGNICMQRKKKRRGSLAQAVERGITHFAEVMKEIELRRIEADNKRWEKMLEMQMRIVELFVRKPS